MTKRAAASHLVKAMAFDTKKKSPAASHRVHETCQMYSGFCARSARTSAINESKGPAEVQTRSAASTAE